MFIHPFSVSSYRNFVAGDAARAQRRVLREGALAVRAVVAGVQGSPLGGQAVLDRVVERQLHGGA